jgi:hypothetical protein
MFQTSNGAVPVLSHNDPVALWKDKSGGNRHGVQTVDANRPLCKFHDRNNRHGLDFDGGNDRFSCLPGTPYAAHFAFAVVRRTGVPPAWAAIYSQRRSLGSPQEFYLAQVGGFTGWIFGQVRPGGIYRRNGVPFTSVNSGLFGVHHANLLPNTTDTCILAVRCDIDKFIGVQKQEIGWDPLSAARCYPMRLYELVICGSLPTLSQIETVERLLSQKWNVPVYS